MGNPKVDTKTRYRITDDYNGSVCEDGSSRDERAKFICSGEKKLDSFTVDSLYRHIRLLGYPPRIDKTFTISLFKDHLQMIPDRRVDSIEDQGVLRSMQCALDRGIVDAAENATSGETNKDWLTELTTYTLNRVTQMFDASYENFSFGTSCRKPENLSALSFETLSKPENTAKYLEQFGDPFVTFIHAAITSSEIDPSQHTHLANAAVYLIEHHADKITPPILRDVLAFEQRIEHPELREVLYGNEVDPPSPIIKAVFDKYNEAIKDPSAWGVVEYPYILALALRRGHPDAVAEMRDIIVKDTHNVLAARAPDGDTVWAFLQPSKARDVLPHLRESYLAASYEMRSELPELLRQPSFHVINLLEILGRDQSGAKHLQTVEAEYRATFDEEDMKDYRPLSLLDYSQFIAGQTANQHLPYKESKHNMIFEYLMGNDTPMSHEMKRRMYDKDLRRTDFDPDDWTNFLSAWSQMAPLDGLPSADNAMQAIFHLVNHPCVATADALAELTKNLQAYDNRQDSIQIRIKEVRRTEANFEEMGLSEWYSWGYTDESLAEKRAANDEALASIPEWEQEITHLKVDKEKMLVRVSKFFDRELAGAALTRYISNADEPSGLHLGHTLRELAKASIENKQEPAKLYEAVIAVALKTKNPDVVAEMVDVLKLAEEKHAYATHATPPYQGLKQLVLRGGKVSDIAWKALKEVITAYWNQPETISETPTASGDPSKAPAPDKSMVYLESLEEIASITNPHVVDAADMLLQRFYATDDETLFTMLQDLDTIALQGFVATMGNNSSGEQASNAKASSAALKVITDLSLLSNESAYSFVLTRFGQGDTTMSKTLEIIASDENTQLDRTRIVETVLPLTLEIGSAPLYQAAFRLLKSAAQYNVPGSFDALTDNVLTHFDMTGLWEGRSTEAADALLSLSDPEMNMELSGSLQTLDTYLASFIGEPESSDDDIDPSLSHFRRLPHGDYLAQFNEAVEDFYDKRNELREAERLAQAARGGSQHSDYSPNGTPVRQVNEEGPYLTPEGQGGVSNPGAISSYAGTHGTPRGMTVYVGENGGGDGTEALTAPSEAPVTSGFMVLASPAEVLESSYIAVLHPQVSDGNKKQEISVISNIAMHMPPLQGHAVLRLVDIVFAPVKVSLDVKTYALETLITIAGSVYPKADQGLMILIDDAYTLAHDGSDWGYDVLEIIAEKAPDKFSGPAGDYLQQLDEK